MNTFALEIPWRHYSDVITVAMAPQVTSFTIVYSIVHSCADQWVNTVITWPVFSVLLVYFSNVPLWYFILQFTKYLLQANYHWLIHVPIHHCTFRFRVQNCINNDDMCVRLMHIIDTHSRLSESHYLYMMHTKLIQHGQKVSLTVYISFAYQVSLIFVAHCSGTLFSRLSCLNFSVHR